MLIYNVGFINANGQHDQTQLDVKECNDADVEIIELLNLILSLRGEMDIQKIEYIDYVGCDDDEDEECENGTVRYYICGLGYDEHDHITDCEKYLGDFDTYEEAYEKFVQLQCKDAAWFFEDAPNLYQLLVQLEECEETDEESNCIDVKNKWWIENPNW